jgi:hypothetical protein
LEGYVTRENEPSAVRALLPVYFGSQYRNAKSAAACMISDTGLEEVQRLNPNITTDAGTNPSPATAKLHLLHTFKPMLTHVIACKRGKLTTEQKNEIAAFSFVYDPQNDPGQGQQGPQLKFEPYKPDDEVDLLAEVLAYTKAKEAEVATSSDTQSTRQEASSRTKSAVRERPQIASPISTPK